MGADSDEFIIKLKSWNEAAYRNDVHTAKALFNRVFSECSSHNDRLCQMILVAPGASVFDCYVQRVLIQMGLLKLIEVNKVVNV